MMRSRTGRAGRRGTRAVLAGALLAGAAAAGCAALIKTPEVSVGAVHVESVTLTGGTLLLDLRVLNPNNFELNGTAIDYTLRVGDADAASPRWVDLASGVREAGFTLPPLDTARVEVPLRFDWAAVGTAVRQLLERGRLGYQAEGAVRVDLPGGLRRVPFRRTGKVQI